MIQFTFGSIDGALNALPVGDNLYLCGKNSEEQRNALIAMYEAYVLRDLSSATYQAYVGMRYAHAVENHCYYGLQPLVNLDTLTKLYSEIDIVYNIIFNFGFIWTDTIMLLVGRPSQTESDYAYYFAFYLADLIFRFLFK